MERRKKLRPTAAAAEVLDRRDDDLDDDGALLLVMCMGLAGRRQSPTLLSSVEDDIESDEFIISRMMDMFGS